MEVLLCYARTKRLNGKIRTRTSFELGKVKLMQRNILILGPFVGAFLWRNLCSQCNHIAGMRFLSTGKGQLISSIDVLIRQCKY